MKLIFMGTPDFAVPTLESLIAGGHNVIVAVTQPDRKGNRNITIAPPVKVCAVAHGIEVLQYEKVSRDGLDALRACRADAIITCAFGQILSDAVLTMCPHGVLNVHASLLPKYRGSSPIQWAIRNGESETGITIMKTAKAVDSGDILLQKRVPIRDDETAGELFERLSTIGAETLLEALRLIESDSAVFTPQNHSEATHVPMLNKADGKIDFTLNARALDCFARAMDPWPCAFTLNNGEALKVFRMADAGVQSDGATPATVLCADKNGLIVACGGGQAVRLLQVQPANGKRMSDCAYLLGHCIEPGTVLE